MPGNSVAEAEQWAAGIGGPAYAMDDADGDPGGRRHRRGRLRRALETLPVAADRRVSSGSSGASPGSGGRRSTGSAWGLCAARRATSPGTALLRTRRTAARSGSAVVAGPPRRARTGCGVRAGRERGRRPRSRPWSTGSGRLAAHADAAGVQPPHDGVVDRCSSQYRGSRMSPSRTTGRIQPWSPWAMVLPEAVHRLRGPGEVPAQPRPTVTARSTTGGRVVADTVRDPGAGHDQRNPDRGLVGAWSCRCRLRCSPR